MTSDEERCNLADSGVATGHLRNRSNNKVVNDVLRSVVVDRSGDGGIDHEWAEDLLVRFSREVDPAIISWSRAFNSLVYRRFDSSRLNRTAPGGDVNFCLVWDLGLPGSCSASCRIFFIVVRSKPACIGRGFVVG